MTTIKRINWKCPKADYELIRQIARRAVIMAAAHDIDYTNMSDVVMDINATHCNGNKLDLQKLLDADDFNFAHDVFGIAKHIDRSTGELTQFFRPRCSTP